VFSVGCKLPFCLELRRIYSFWALPWLGRIVANLSPRRPGLVTRSIHVRCTSWQCDRFFSVHFGFSPAIIPRMPVNLPKKQYCFGNREVLSRKVIFTCFTVLFDERVCTHYVFCIQFFLNSFSECEIRPSSLPLLRGLVSYYAYALVT
jgi:hypothetical protein